MTRATSRQRCRPPPLRGASNPVVSTSDVIDLYTLRCVTGALLWARHHPLQLSAVELERFDIAVNHLVRTQPELSGEIAAASDALLSDEPDTAGMRTIAAVDYLAQLTQVDINCAAALAAALTAATSPRGLATRRHPSLFDPGDGDAS